MKLAEICSFPGNFSYIYSFMYISFGVYSHCACAVIYVRMYVACSFTTKMVYKKSLQNLNTVETFPRNDKTTPVTTYPIGSDPAAAVWQWVAHKSICN